MVDGSSLTCLLSYIFRWPAIRVAIYPPLLNPEEDGPSLQLPFVTPPPAESLGNQAGRLTHFLSSWGLEAHTTFRN